LTNSRIRLLVIGFWAVLAAWLILKPGVSIRTPPAGAGTDASGQALYWYKGNIHTHARISLGDYVHGDSTPAAVADWYHDRGYHFLSITDHNRYESGQGLGGADGEEPGFLVLPGMEVTSDYLYPGVNDEGERRIHATALNTDDAVEWDFEDADKANIIRLQVERIESLGGVHILNHPNYRFQLEPGDILAAKNVRLFEIHNDHPRSNPGGHAGFRLPVEAVWDQVLSAGQTLYGVASDDAHDFKWYRQLFRRFGTAPPGGGWIMLKAPALSPTHITQALENGDFYASTGVHLKDVSVSDGRYQVELDLESTAAETAHDWVRASAPVIWSDDSHFVVEFIGQNGRLLSSTHNQRSAP
jgi:hypothetical protein